jgi:uncharacterized protein (UPF0218 family)
MPNTGYTSIPWVLIDKCPRAAFLDDLANDIKKSLEEGAHIMVMLDGNEDM